MLMPVVVGCGSGAKADKATAMRSYRRISQIGTFLRCAEILAVLVLLSWSSSRLPDAVRLFTVFLRRLASLVVSTPFAFLLGNAIVLTLLAKSKRQHSNCVAAPSPDQHSICDEFLHVAPDIRGDNSPRSIPPPEAQQRTPAAAAEVAYEDKAICIIEAKPERRRFRRTKSEQMNGKRGEEMGTNNLRRTTTGVARKKDDDEWAAALAGTEEEEESETTGMMRMSNEELRRRVEAFIAKQMRFRREESIAMAIAGD